LASLEAENIINWLGWRSPMIQNQITRPGKHAKNYGKSQFLMGKSTISMAMFNSYVSYRWYWEKMSKRSTAGWVSLFQCVNHSLESQTLLKGTC